MPLQNIPSYQVAVEKINLFVNIKYVVFWLSQKLLAAFSGIEKTADTKHLKNIFETHELQEISFSPHMAYNAVHLKNYNAQYFRMNAIPAVFYWVNTVQAIYFRIWASVAY